MRMILSKKEQNQRGKAIVALALMFVMLAMMHLTAFADDDYVYYETYAEWQEAGGVAETWNDKADVIEDVLNYAVSLFEQGIFTKDDGTPNAYDVVNKGGYYGYYETTGFERATNGFSGSRVSQIELQFKTCRQTAKKAESVEESLETFKTEIATLIQWLHEDANTLDGVTADASADTSKQGTEGTSTSADAMAWSSSFLIILREGFEAILIVGAIVAYLKVSAGDDKKEQRRKARPVYLGALIGIAASFLLAWLLNAIKLANTASQEIIEGVTALIAVCVLYYVSNWMLSKSETDAWTGYIKSKVAKSSERGSMFALAFTAFLAVFREGAEVVLFYQPLLGQGRDASVWSGFIIGCILLVFVWLLIRFLSIKIPIKPFFIATSILMFIMSISFLGAGIKELIEGDVIGATSPAWLQWIPYTDFLDMLGIYPVLETLIPQLILLIVTIIIFVVVTKKNQKIHAEAEAKRAEERAIREAQEKVERETALTGYITNVVNGILADRGLIPPIDGEKNSSLIQEAQTLLEQTGDAVANAGDIAKNAENEPDNH